MHSGLNSLKLEINLFLHKLYYLVYRVINVSFSQGGACVPCPPSMNPRRPCVVVTPLWSWWMSVMGRCIQVNEVSMGVGWLGEPWCAYLKRLSPAQSSHWGCCTLIRVCWYLGSSYAAVGGAHQSDNNPTIDVSTRLRVGLFPLGGQATG